MDEQACGELQLLHVAARGQRPGLDSTREWPWPPSLSFSHPRQGTLAVMRAKRLALAFRAADLAATTELGGPDTRLGIAAGGEGQWQRLARSVLLGSRTARRHAARLSVADRLLCALSKADGPLKVQSVPDPSAPIPTEEPA